MVKKITVYIIANCPFCKEEKEYLSSHNLIFEEKNVEEHREYLAEMLAASDKFAGVPFTIIIKEDGSTAKLKGFTKEEFDEVLGFAVQSTVTPAVPPPASEPIATDTPVQSQQTPTPTPPVPEPVPSPVPPPTEPVPGTPPPDPNPAPPIPPPPVTSDVAPVEQSTPPSTPVVSTAQVMSDGDPLKGVLDNLQNLSGPSSSVTPSNPTGSVPHIPDFPAK